MVLPCLSGLLGSSIWLVQGNSSRSSSDDEPPIYHQYLSGDEAPCVGGEQQCRPDDFAWVGGPIQECEAPGQLAFGLWAGEVEFRGKRSWRERVHADPVTSQTSGR
jgi:hypothetical protein